MKAKRFLACAVLGLVAGVGLVGLSWGFALEHGTTIERELLRMGCLVVASLLGLFGTLWALFTLDSK